MAFAIVINEKGGQPRRQEFLKGEITIGRVQGNDIVLPKQNVSKRHSRVVLKNGKFVITDLKSTNGTYVNGRKITTPMVIKETDKIYIGDFVLSAELSDGASEGASTPGFAPPPPPATSLSGARPPFPGNMPSKTIASGVSPFQDPATSTPAMPTPPQAPTPPAMEQQAPSLPPAPPPTASTPPALGSSPFGGPNDANGAGQPALGAQPPAPSAPVAPPAPSISSPFSNAQDKSPEPFAPATSIGVSSMPSPAPQSPSSPFGGSTPANEPSTNASASLPVPPTQSPAISAPPSPAISAPPSPALAAPPSLGVLSNSPASVELDASVFDGEADNAQFVQMHQALNEGLTQKGLLTPTRYRPGQSLNPALIDAAYEILKDLTQDHSEDGVALIMNEAFGVGALQPLIEDSNVQEIYLNGAHQLVYKQAHNAPAETVSSPFTSVEQAARAAKRLLNGLGREGQTCAEGKLGPFRVFVNLEGAEGPYVCLQRAAQPNTLSALVAQGAFNPQLAESVKTLVERGGKIVIASPHKSAQAQLTSAIARELLSARRVVSVGVSQHLGDDPSWLTVEGSDEALEGVERLNPDAVIISDQASLSGDKVFEALSASSAGLLMLTARDINGAVNKLRRRAGDDMLAVEAADAILFVSGAEVTDVYHVAQGQVIFSQGAWSGALI